MTNEEAFKSWFDNQILGNESWEDGLREAWQAAITYMQEQNKSAEQSEPVATIYNGIAYWIGKEPPEGTNLFTTPQRVEASSTGVATRQLKRLSDEQINEICEEWRDYGYRDLGNAIMDEIERINK